VTLLAAILTNNGLAELCLRSCRINDFGMSVIAAALKTNYSLQELVHSDNNIGDENLSLKVGYDQST
jgi:hypothetical protein